MLRDFLTVLRGCCYCHPLTTLRYLHLATFGITVVSGSESGYRIPIPVGRTPLHVTGFLSLPYASYRSVSYRTASTLCHHITIYNFIIILKCNQSWAWTAHAQNGPIRRQIAKFGPIRSLVSLRVKGTDRPTNRQTKLIIEMLELTAHSI